MNQTSYILSNDIYLNRKQRRALKKCNGDIDRAMVHLQGRHPSRGKSSRGKGHLHRDILPGVGTIGQESGLPE